LKNMAAANVRKLFSAPKSRVPAVFALSILLLASLLLSQSLHFASAQSSTGTIRDFYVAAEYDFGGKGYNAFSPQTLVVQQGDQVNITVRNLGNQTFQLNIEGQPSVTIQPGSQSASGLTPVETSVSIFTASTPGIFNFYTAEHPEMNGQLVVLPPSWSSYNPAAQTRSFTQLILPDFAGVGYDKYFPGMMVVNQGDTVNVTVRNTDDMAHGFALPSYSINVVVNSGQLQSNGSLVPLNTAIPSFTASTPGLFQYVCTVPCGGGHSEMVGSLIVLPRGSSAYSPESTVVYSYLVVKPDFASEGYDKYVPETVFANVNDLVYIEVRNTDPVPHGFTLVGFGVNNETILAAQNTTSGIVPTDTYVTAFVAAQPGVYEFFCSNYCGEGHNEMVGYLVVLPSQAGGSPSVSASPPVQVPPNSISEVIVVGLAIAMLMVGIVIGVILVVKFNDAEAKPKA
jgi:heme/copper-type cytochrome/quinol oxidase subunit 2